MGTNYTAIIRDGDKTKELHIGKSSSGWVFSLRVYPVLGINTLYDWIDIFINPTTKIVDEYSSEWTATAMIRTIMWRSRSNPLEMSDTELKQNYAIIDPKHNLLRDNLEGAYGLKKRHGEGTWDYCYYEFF